MTTEKLKGASTMKESKYAGTQTEKNLMAAFAGESEARFLMIRRPPRSTQWIMLLEI